MRKKILNLKPINKGEYVLLLKNWRFKYFMILKAGTSKIIIILNNSSINYQQNKLKNIMKKRAYTRRQRLVLPKNYQDLLIIEELKFEGGIRSIDLIRELLYLYSVN